jgi:SAM-dependent methyltransferase
MKVRESGMPPQVYWETLFDVSGVLGAFGFDAQTGDVVELGCGYGTFTVPLAARIGGTVHALDFEPAMVATTRARAGAAGLCNVSATVCDAVADGFGVGAGTCEACLLFNILHGEEPVALLRAARATVRVGGLLAVMHWRSDVVTPRGPSLEIRPRASQIAAWAETAGGLRVEGEPLDLPPWHFGLKLRVTAAEN